MFKVNNTCNLNMLWCKLHCQVVKKKRWFSLHLQDSSWPVAICKDEGEERAGLMCHSPMLPNHGTCKAQERGRPVQGHLGLGMQTNGLTHCSKGSCDWACGQHTSARKASQLGTVAMPSFSARACERAPFDFWSNPFKIFAMGLCKSPFKNMSGMPHTWELILGTSYRDYDQCVHNSLR